MDLAPVLARMQYQDSSLETCNSTWNLGWRSDLRGPKPRQVAGAQVVLCC